MLLILFLLLVLMIVAGVVSKMFRSRIDSRTVENLDLNRYMGEWFEIARLETRFERGMVAVTARYRLLPDGTVEVVNSGLCPQTGERKTSVGRAKATKVPGRLKVSFVRFIYSDYNVLELGPDYQWALVGGRSAGYLWMLSRTPAIDEATFEDLRARAQARGYDVEQLLKVDQSANR